MEHAYVKSGDEILRFFNVDERSGLDDNQVRASRARYGRNGKELSCLGIWELVLTFFRAL